MDLLNDTPLQAPEMDQNTRILVDSDYWTYQIAACVQHKDPQPGQTVEVMENSIGDLFHMESLDALHNLMDAQINDLRTRFQSDHVEIYLQGKNNFRDEVAVTKPYKGGRPKVKPIYYEECRRYLIDKYDAEVIDGMETDDMVSIRQTQCMKDQIPSVIVSPDKDLKNTHGYLYNPMKKTLMLYTSMASARHFWEQMVIGDNSVDNIPGVYRVGEAWVKKHHDYNYYQLRAKVTELYTTKHDIVYMIEQGNLLHMLRDGDEPGRWLPDYDYFADYWVPDVLQYTELS